MDRSLAAFEPERIIQVAASAPGWGHWTRVLAIARELPDFGFEVYHPSPHVPLPPLVPNVVRVDRLRVGKPVVLEHGWECARPHRPNAFATSFCVRKASRTRPDMAPIARVLTVQDLGSPGDVSPVVLRTPAVKRPFAPRVIVSSESSNRTFLKERHPEHSDRIQFPITAFRRSLEHVAGIAGYNLFWECVHYRIPCTLYPSTWFNDSIERMHRLRQLGWPDQVKNGAPEVAEALRDWWSEVS